MIKQRLSQSNKINDEILACREEKNDETPVDREEEDKEKEILCQDGSGVSHEKVMLQEESSDSHDVVTPQYTPLVRSQETSKVD